MQRFSTNLGTLNDVSRFYTYENGELDSLCLDSEHKLHTSVGTLVPRYKDFTGRRKTTKCLSFYPTGKIKSIDLQDQTSIPTPLGDIDAELVTFYENETIKRIFPLNGVMNGMWSESDEAELAHSISFHLLDADFNLKINNIFFYSNGNVKSVSFFPGETAFIPTPYGNVKTRIGLSLSEDGSLLTLEPAIPFEIKTPIGILHAFDSNAVGINADRNSLVFNTNHNITEIVTSTDIIKLTDRMGKLHYLTPVFVESMIHFDEKELLPLKIIFSSTSVTFTTTDQFTINLDDIVKIELSTIPLVSNECTDCASCGKCSSVDIPY